MRRGLHLLRRADPLSVQYGSIPKSVLMSIELEHKLEKIPVIKYLVRFGKSIKLPYSEGLTLYHLLELYISGIVKGDISYRAGAIAFSFFMSLFPFALFLLNLIPHIPLEGFREDFMQFVAENVPP